MLAGGLDGWTNQRWEVVTNAVCALFLMSRAPPVPRERLKEGGKVTQFLANLSKRGSEVQKKVTQVVGIVLYSGSLSCSAAVTCRALDNAELVRLPAFRNTPPY